MSSWSSWWPFGSGKSSSDDSQSQQQSTQQPSALQQQQLAPPSQLQQQPASATSSEKTFSFDKPSGASNAGTPASGPSKQPTAIDAALGTMAGIRAATVAPAIGIFNPRQAEFIEMDASGATFDKMTYRMGLGYLAGLGVGGGFGLLEGMFLGQRTNFKLWFNSVLNATTRRGPKAANAMGTVVMLVCTAEWVWGMVRDREDGMNLVLGAATAGAFYKSSLGLKKAALGAGVGAALGTGYVGLHFVREHGFDTERALINTTDAVLSLKELAALPDVSGWMDMLKGEKKEEEK